MGCCCFLLRRLGVPDKRFSKKSEAQFGPVGAADVAKEALLLGNCPASRKFSSQNVPCRLHANNKEQSN